MEASVTEYIFEEDLEVLKGNALSDKEALIKLFFDKLSSDEEETLFAGFCQNIRETFCGVDWAGDVSFENPEQGYLNVSFRGEAYMGCKDMIPEYDYDEVVDFHIDYDNSTITFSTNIPEVHERDPETF